MRRPLFWVALFLILIAAIRLETGSLDVVQSGTISAQSLGSCQELMITGQVYKKDNRTIYLQNVSVDLKYLLKSENSIITAISEAGLSRQYISCNDNIICKLTEPEEIPLGSYVTLKGSFAPISPATNPGEFDAVSYYRTIGVGGRLSRGSLLGRGKAYWPVREGLYDLRQYLENRLYRALPESRAGVLCALLLGDKGGLEERVEDLYRQSGILHILSISSLHITILGMSLYRLLRRLRVPVGLAALAGSVLLLLYGGLTGFGVSSCRAIGMYLIRMLGEVLGRTYDMLTALGVMGALMVWQNPYYLHHSGFLLSFSSVLGVGVLCPGLTVGGLEVESSKSVGTKGIGTNGIGAKGGQLLDKLMVKVRQSALASLSVVLVTLPVQLWYYYEVPVYAVFLNLLVLPLVKPLMLAGFLAMLFPCSVLPGMAAGGILKWYEWLCELCGSLPFHNWNPGRPKLWQIGVYYLLLMMMAAGREKVSSLALFLKKQNTKSGKVKLCRTLGEEKYFERIVKTATGAVVICAVFVLGFTPKADNHVSFLDVGQGDCILVQTASGKNYLFDCGSTSRRGVGEYVLIPFLKYSGIQVLDAVFVSHPDRDHMSGILELFSLGRKNGLKVCQLVLPNLREAGAEQLAELAAAAGLADFDSGVDVRYISAGEVWECGGARFTCLNPETDRSLEDVNAGSQCFYVEFFMETDAKESGRNAGTLLLTGDVEGEGERALLEQLVQRGICQVDVLKVAHHGSRGTTSQELLEQISPKLAVISCGRNNRYGHPHAELLERLEQAGCLILETPKEGALFLSFPRGKIRLESFGAGL